MRPIFFVDFDGTITLEDTCTAMVKAFAEEGWQEINRLWERKELSTQECAEQTFRLIQAGPEEMGGLLQDIGIDPYFPAFTRYCRQYRHPLYILSDGYDLNIQAVLQKHDIDIPYYANRLLYTSQFHIESPHRNEACGLCGTCKSRLMERLTPPGRRTVYIGDGYSDTCPAAKADQVFAKGDLLTYCRQHNIAAIPFQTFHNILEHIVKTEQA